MKPFQAHEASEAVVAQGAGVSASPVSPVILPGLARALDVAAIFCAGFTVTIFQKDVNIIDNPQYIFFICSFTMFYCIVSAWGRLYSLNAIIRPLNRIDDIVIAVATSLMLLSSFVFGLNASANFELNWIIWFGAGSLVATVTSRLLLARAGSILDRRGLLCRNLAVLGAGEQGRRCVRKLKDAPLQFSRLVGVYRADTTEDPKDIEGIKVIGDVEALMLAARTGQISDVLIAMPWSADKELTETISRLKELPINVLLATDLIGFELSFRSTPGVIGSLPMFEVVQRPISGWHSAIKQTFDYLVAGALLIITAPLLLAIAVAIKLDTPGPVFFMQPRLGFNNKEFRIFKFRSMRHHATPESVVRQATKADPRVTRVGRFIRATSLDELPQLLNVLNGTMSLVGPRPHALSHNEEYGRLIRGYFARHKVKPGITGWAQVNGLRGETTDVSKMEARIKYDVYYTENWSLFFDIRIIIMTAVVALFQKSAY